MKELRGVSVSPGIVIGKAYLYLEDRTPIPSYSIQPNEVGAEMDRFHLARRKASEEIQILRQRSSEAGEKQDERFLDAHLLMLSDPEFIGQVESQLGEDLRNVEWIIQSVVESLVRQLEESNDSYLRERAVDIYDVANRVLNHLLYRERASLANLDEEIVLVTHNLLPSDTMVMNKELVKAIAMDAGSRTSHTAILARSFGISAVLGLSDITRHVSTGSEIIVDGNAGHVIVEPDAKTKKRYLTTSRKWTRHEVSLLTLNDLPAETRDGKRVELNANIEVPDETRTVSEHGADGIGLYRSEFLFLQSGGPPTEDVQCDAYTRVVRDLEGKTVTIRTLDLGGDKVMPAMEHRAERNPILGWRAIRFCLSKRNIFRTQLRAILRASAHGNVRIMFPMISGVEELLETLSFLEQVKEECRQEGIPFDERMPVGTMIEIPAAAMTSDILARHVQFFSIGTNDLIQYTVAVDRDNEKIAYLYEPFHPGVLRLIKTVIDNAHAANVPVDMCGEMAGDPYATVVLLGLGLDGFSMSAFSIPQVKQIIRSVSTTEAKELVSSVMGMSSPNEINKSVTAWMHDRFAFLGT